MISNENDSVNDPFKVYVRIRPLLEKEQNIDKDSEKSTKERERYSVYKNGIKVENNMICILDSDMLDTYPKKEKCFMFDEVFSEKDDNQAIFNKIVKNLVNNIMNGYNATAMAYGVTGTGKTHTMFGDTNINLSFGEKGICLHAIDYLFDMISKDNSKSFHVKTNYIEIYNEQVIDLLVEKREESYDYLMIIEDPIKGVLVPEAREYIVTSTEEVMNLIQIGNSRRVMAPTGANQFSSRSHAILQIIVEQKSILANKEEVTSSKLLLVDLAGSERGSLEKGLRREEGANINKSLLALGNCINILSDKQKKGSFVPYRDSKLTRLLKDSLGGNISTIMIACISPSIMSQDETINTLKYASRARKIQKKITRNVKEIDPNFPQYKEIEGLKKEISQLREVINNQNILLRYKPVDSFFDGRDLNNLNLFTKNKGQMDASYKENNDINNIYNELKSKLLSSNSIQADFPSNNVNIISNINFEVYEDFMKKNFNSLTEEELEEFSKKLESLYFDKISLEDKIMRGGIDSTTNEKYSILKMFFQKYIELINEKLIENIENILILKFNLKEILELNEANDLHLKNINSQIESSESNENELKILNKEKEELEKIILDNEKEKEEIGLGLEKNLKLKKILKDLLLKFISNTQIKEIKDLREAFICIENDKRELELKNKKYQEFLNTVLREKEDYEKKLQELTKELEITKKKLLEKEKKLTDADKKIKDLDSLLKSELKHSVRVTQNKYHDHSRLSSVARKYFSNDSICRNRSKKKLTSTSTIINDCRKYSVNSNNRGITNNYININVTSKIPRVTAILQNGNLITTSVSNINFSQPSNSISALKKNLDYNSNLNSKSSSNKNSSKTVTDFRQNYKVNSNPINLENFVGPGMNLNKKETNFGKKNSDRNFSNLKTSLINYNSLTQNSKDKMEIKSSKNIRINLNSDKNIKPNYTTIFSAVEKEKLKINNNNLDSFSVSAVSINNDVCMNSSVLEIMENVLNLDGIKNQKKCPERKSSTNCVNKDENKENFESVNYISEFLKRNKLKDNTTDNNKVNDLIEVKKIKNKNENFNSDDIFNRALHAVKESDIKQELV